MNNDKGALIAGALFELLLFAIVASLTLRLIHSVSKETLFHITQQKVENNISKTLATFYSMNHRPSNIWGLPMYQWRNEHETHPNYLQEGIERLKNNNRIKTGSIFLETIDSSPVFLSRHHSDTEKVFLGDIPPKYVQLIREDRWILFSASGLYRIRQKSNNTFLPTENIWKISLPSSSTLTPLLDATKEIPDSENFILLNPIQDHVILYLNLQNELRRYSLFTYDNQPVSEHISGIYRTATHCIIKGSLRSVQIEHKFPCKNTSFEPFLYFDFLDL